MSIFIDIDQKRCWTKVNNISDRTDEADLEFQKYILSPLL